MYCEELTPSNCLDKFLQDCCCCFLQDFKSALTLPAKIENVWLAQGHLAGLVPIFAFPCTKYTLWYLDVRVRVRVVIKSKDTDLRPNFLTHISQIPISSVFSPSRIYIGWRCLCYYILVQLLQGWPLWGLWPSVLENYIWFFILPFMICVHLFFSVESCHFI